MKIVFNIVPGKSRTEGKAYQDGFGIGLLMRGRKWDCQKHKWIRHRVLEIECFNLGKYEIYSPKYDMRGV